jgi:hypothetical protein
VVGIGLVCWERSWAEEEGVQGGCSEEADLEVGDQKVKVSSRGPKLQ